MLVLTPDAMAGGGSDDGFLACFSGSSSSSGDGSDDGSGGGGGAAAEVAAALIRVMLNRGVGENMVPAYDTKKDFVWKALNRVCRDHFVQLWVDCLNNGLKATAKHKGWDTRAVCIWRALVVLLQIPSARGKQDAQAAVEALLGDLFDIAEQLSRVPDNHRMEHKGKFTGICSAPSRGFEPERSSNMAAQLVGGVAKYLSPHVPAVRAWLVLNPKQWGWFPDWVVAKQKSTGLLMGRTPGPLSKTQATAAARHFYMQLAAQIDAHGADAVMRGWQCSAPPVRAGAGSASGSGDVDDIDYVTVEDDDDNDDMGIASDAAQDSDPTGDYESSDSDDALSTD